MVDHHAHAVLRHGPETLEELRGLFSESPDPRQWAHVPNALSYRRGLVELAGHLGCEPTEEAVLATRRRVGVRDYAASLLGATGTDWLLLDDGFPPAEAAFAPAEMAELAGCRVGSVMRLERVAEEAMAEDPSLDAVRDRVRAEVRGARRRGVVALKTIVAYRGGLDMGLPDPDAAARALAASGPRLRARALVGRSASGRRLEWGACEE